MARNNIGVLTSEECCGCKACGDCCPKNAIVFRLDGEGFFHPAVDETLCVDCGRCTKVCPALNRIQDNDLHIQSFIGCLDKDKARRDTGSSGGIFGLLANHLLEKGYIVCGAAFDDELKLRHQFAATPEDTERLKKSKYLQSDCTGIYKSIKDRLNRGDKVMFVGTPCQCNALRNYIGGGNDHLTVIDFACHGVPSQSLFDKCLQYYEQKYDCKVTGYSFRYKPKPYGAPQNFLLHISRNGKESKKCGKYYEEAFYCGFQKYITLRTSCYSCKWANTRRVSDVTLADFWGIESVTSKWDRTDHPSLVILNTSRGQELFDAIKDDTDFIVVDKDDAVKGNGVLTAPTRIPKEREVFFDDLRTKPFEYVVERHLRLKRRWVKDVYYAIPFAVRKVMLNVIKRINHA